MESDTIEKTDENQVEKPVEPKIEDSVETKENKEIEDKKVIHEFSFDLIEKKNKRKIIKNIRKSVRVLFSDLHK